MDVYIVTVSEIPTDKITVHVHTVVPASNKSN